MTNEISPPSQHSLAPSYVCDTIPAPKLASMEQFDTEQLQSTSPSSIVFDIPPIVEEDSTSLDIYKSETLEKESVPFPPQPPGRKLCVRHQRMADEGTNSKLQQSLDALPLEEREAVNAIWSNFSSSLHPRRALILNGLLTMCCFTQLSLLAEQLAYLIRIDPFTIFPREVSLKILRNLDAKSLCRAAQVSKQWRSLADDDVLWRGICEQHIGQKCKKCGWGLPRLAYRHPFRASPSPGPRVQSRMDKRAVGVDFAQQEPPLKRQRAEASGSSDLRDLRPSPSISVQNPPRSSSNSPSFTPPANLPVPLPNSITRPWKDVYSERLTIERNWRRGICTVRTLKGHTDGVMCLQFDETYSILITGSYDRTTRVWNLETGAQMRCLNGHTEVVRALQFDRLKLITGSMDSTIRVWNWRTGECIRTLRGHDDGVVCLNFDSNVLASGSVDATVKVWNLRTGEAFTLSGHRDWVNCVQLWTPDSMSLSHSPLVESSLPGSPSSTPSLAASSAPHIDTGKMLFSGSDDGTIRLWDLTLRTCVRQFTGHVGQVQSVKLMVLDEGSHDEGTEEYFGADAQPHAQDNFKTVRTSAPLSAERPARLSAPVASNPPTVSNGPRSSPSPSGSSISKEARSLTPSLRRFKTILISGCLDNTVKIWDIETGKTVRTLFGHIEGVWGVASDKLRLVTGSHDRTIKVWNCEDGSCTATLVGHLGAVTCVSLGEDKIVSGSDDKTIKIWSFGNQ